MNRNRWKVTALILAVVFVLVSCGARKTPKDAALLFMKSMRSGDYSEAASCVVESIDAKKMAEEYESMGGAFLDKMRDLEYEVLETTDGDTNATVTMKVSYYNLAGVYTEVMKQLLADVKSDEKIRMMDDDALATEAMNRLNAAAKDAKLTKMEKTLKLAAKKGDGGWQIVLDNPELREVITAGLNGVSGIL